MTEKELIAKIQGLKQIKPNQEWAILAKNRILGGETGKMGVMAEARERVAERSKMGEIMNVGVKVGGNGFSFGDFVRGLWGGENFVFQHKFAFSGAFVLLFVVGLFGLAEISLPGDALFSLKKVAENGQSVFVPQNGEVEYNIGLVNRRLDELTKIAKNNTIKNLASAIDELQTSVSRVAGSLTKSSVNKATAKDIVADVKNIEKKVEAVRSLGVEINESKELDNALARIVEDQIMGLESQSLNEEGQVALRDIQTDYEAGNYSSALEKILLFPQLTEQ